MESAADTGVSVIFASHMIGDLERICDYLVILVASRVRLAGDIDELLASHHQLIGPRRDPATLPDVEVIAARHTERQTTWWSARSGRSTTRPGPSPRSAWKTWSWRT